MVAIPQAGVDRARLATAWAVYQELHFSCLAPKTRAEYRGAVLHALAELPPVLDAAAVLRWHRALLQRYCASYSNQCLFTLRTVAKRAAIVTGDHELAGLVCQVPPVREPSIPPPAPPADLVARALDLCRNPAERLFVRIAGFAGLRRGEILGLRPEDWDRASSKLQVVRQRRAPHRKNRRPHAVSVTDPTMVAELEWTIAHAATVRARTGWFRGASDGFIFPWSLRRAENLLARIRAGLPPGYLPRRRGWHSFRHWGATQLARGGASVWDVMRWLGDADPKMAARYVDLYGASNADGVAALARIAKLGAAAVAAAAAPSPSPSSASGAVPAADGGATRKGMSRVHPATPHTRKRRKRPA